jgi:flagellar basal body-associated protein FliL
MYKFHDINDLTDLSSTTDTTNTTQQNKEPLNLILIIIASSIVLAPCVLLCCITLYEYVFKKENNITLETIHEEEEQENDKFPAPAYMNIYDDIGLNDLREPPNYN